MILIFIIFSTLHIITELHRLLFQKGLEFAELTFTFYHRIFAVIIVDNHRKDKRLFRRFIFIITYSTHHTIAAYHR